ncbi:MAG: PEP-CTERM sorting domain-containing protein [Cyanophyceae cyanobacterium]
MNTLLKGAAVISTAVIGIGFADAANAGTIVNKSVDFLGDGSGLFSDIFKDLGNGVEVSVTAGYHGGGASANAPFPSTAPAFVSLSNSSGLGVRSSLSDGNRLDAGGRDEFLRFTFSQEVTLQGVFFSSVFSGNDEFDAAIDNVDLQINDTFGTDRLFSFPGIGSVRVVDFSGGVDFAGDGTNALRSATGTIFDFYTNNNNDDYRIAKLKIKTEVPEPAAILGLLGVGAMVVGSARKRQEA